MKYVLCYLQTSVSRCVLLSFTVAAANSRSLVTTFSRLSVAAVSALHGPTIASSAHVQALVKLSLSLSLS